MKNQLALTLVMNMKPLVALPDERLTMQSGRKVPGLFVIVSGTCEYSPSGLGGGGPMLIHKGDCFGYELLAHSKPEARIATASVKPLEICEFMFLSAENFEALLTSKQPEHDLFITTLRGLWAQGRGSLGKSGLIRTTSARQSDSASFVRKDRPRSTDSESCDEGHGFTRAVARSQSSREGDDKQIRFKALASELATQPTELAKV